ncbi:Mitochondrial Ribosomal Protein Large [Trichostrongylus colubriformis]|uniref:Large ribosomal subunit protein mL43 n=1 Tax=Trichostrongylus colubriformis TaxID=6319 RepID=A0AAN8F7X8_TRICO
MPAVPRVDRIKTIYSAAKALNYSWRFTDFLRTPAYNGVSRYMPQLHRITFRFCKQGEASVGVRNFIEHKLLELGARIPSVVIYTQPVRNSNPIICAEYGNGRVVQLNAKNMSMTDVERDVNLLYSRSGLPVVKLESLQSAATPSLQGEWTPMTWLSPRLNSAKLPDPEFSEHKTCKVTATDYLIEQQKRSRVVTMPMYHVPRSTRIIKFWKNLPHHLIKTYPEQTIMFATFGTASFFIAIYKIRKYLSMDMRPYYRGYYDVVRSDDPLAKTWRKPEDYPAPYLSDGIEYAC